MSRDEVEAKFRVREAARVRARLRALGYRAGARRREQNWIFDDAAGTLGKSGRLLRLRRSGSAWRLTAKGPARMQGAVKRRAESETGVSDGAVCRRLLQQLGYRRVLSYGRWRTEWRRTGETGAVCWDETPIGMFVELEGPVRWIRQTAKLLGLTEPEARSYPELYGKPAVS